MSGVVSGWRYWLRVLILGTLLGVLLFALYLGMGIL